MWVQIHPFKSVIHFSSIIFDCFSNFRKGRKFGKKFPAAQEPENNHENGRFPTHKEEPAVNRQAHGRAIGGFDNNDNFIDEDFEVIY